MTEFADFVVTVAIYVAAGIGFILWIKEIRGG
jgi:hypothetical protein